MDAGKVVMDGTPRHVFSHVRQMQELGLGVPQITELAFRLNMKDTILSVDEFIRSYKPTQYNHQQEAPPQQSTTPLLSCKNLTHTYNAGSVFEKKALDNVSLTITKGEMAAIIGHTGSGKSTLIQHLNALLKPTSGKVLLNNEDIHADKAKLKSIRQRVGLVFQYPEHQLFEPTVYKDVSFGPIKMGLPKEEIDERVRGALAIVGVGEALYEKSPFELSGGQKRRVAIAGVLAMRPEILVLDEPTAGLDPGGKDEILHQIKQMHEQLGITVILVSHSMEDVARLCDKIYVMNKGSLMCEGTPAEVFTQGDLLKSVGLDIPQISRLFLELHKKDPAAPTGIFSIEQAVAAV